ncbi:MAG: DUF523 and DUF1722 domain-containing protein [Candidatus Cloacimonas sp.]|jgi:uncharacterized protein YbgA (DUF1722 family)/uncharacterized protein YbbK (DUF523 family)|nr:DUF523 and DUF1722 domain-containing protein [Candidatus Cloacimonas sp.]
MTDTKIKLGISSCLLGNNVRYDGGHKYDSWLVEMLGNYVAYVAVCPEVGCGLPIPREAMRLVGNVDSPSLLTQKTLIDHTQRMLDYSCGAVKKLASEQLCGFVFKRSSPSSGMERVKVYPPTGGVPAKTGVGIFARAFMAANPLLPCEEEGRLHDPELRENFIVRIFVMNRWQQLIAMRPKANDLMQFHARHKLLLMAHSPAYYRSMGKLVAETAIKPVETLLTEYFTQLMTALKKPATLKKHQNVLLHILGYFKNDLTAAEKAELIELIDQFKAGLLPLIVPITMLNHYVRKYDKAYLALQHYLNPHPIELKLRNHC